MSPIASGLEPSLALHTESLRQEPAEVVDDGDGEVDRTGAAPGPGSRPWKRILAYGVLPGLALILALGAGYLKWQGDSTRQSQTARGESVQVATDSTVALLSYHPETIDKDLAAARDRLTGAFRDSYTQLINDVVIPGAKQKHISAVATVPAAAPVSSTENHAVVLLFVNQTISMGDDPSTSTASSVRVTLDKVAERWLISQFEPV